MLQKMDFFTIFARTLPIFLRVFPNFTVSKDDYLGPVPQRNGVLFDIIERLKLVN